MNLWNWRKTSRTINNMKNKEEHQNSMLCSFNWDGNWIYVLKKVPRYLFNMGDQSKGVELNASKVMMK